MNHTICGGLTVIEMGAGSAAASMVGMVLADLGARVVKIEAPGGDRLRTLSPSGFLVWNRGKESVVADLRTEAGRARVRELAAGADIVVEGFSPGVADGWVVGAAALCGADPSLVYCAISGFGPTGNYSRLKGYEALVAAKAGVFARGSYAPRNGPIYFPQLSGSYGAAMMALGGIAGALLVRDQTGHGQRVDATLVQGLDPLDYFSLMITLMMRRAGNSGVADTKSGAMAFTRYGLLVGTRDGRFIQTSTVLPHQAQSLTRVAGLGALLDLPQNKNLPMFDSPEDAQVWEDQMWEAFRTKTLTEWLPLLLADPDIAFEVAATSEEGLDHPQIVHNGNAITVDDPVHGPVRQVGPLAGFRGSPAVITRSAPALDAHDPLPSPRSPSTVPAANGTGDGGGDGDGRHAAGPLTGVTIVEFGYFYAMPFGVSMAADLGARVIKLEDRVGDPMRRSFGPEVGSVKTTSGKESLSLDLASEAGRKIAHEVLAKADVFVLGFRSGVAERLGIDHDTVSRLNPRIVYVHAAGYGVDGPYAHRALYAQAAQAVAGSFGRQVGHWIDPELNVDLSVPELQAVIAPRLAHIVDGDSNAALAVLPAICLGVLHQRRTGRGQFVVASMIGGNALAYSDDFCTYADKVSVPVCDAENMGTGALSRLYEAAEGWVCIVVPTEGEWTRFTEAIGRQALPSDPRFATVAARNTNDALLIEELTAVFAERPAPEWESLLAGVDVGCVAVREDSQSAFTLDDPVMRETGRSLEVGHPLFGTVVRSGVPVDLSLTPGRARPGCVRGEHNTAILHELGYSADAIAELEADGVIFAPDPLPAR